MTSDRWQRIEELYHSAWERESSQRAAFLKEARARDDALRREVECLLAQETGVEKFLEAMTALRRWNTRSTSMRYVSTRPWKSAFFGIGRATLRRFSDRPLSSQSADGCIKSLTFRVEQL